MTLRESLESLRDQQLKIAKDFTRLFDHEYEDVTLLMERQALETESVVHQLFGVEETTYELL